MKYAALLIGSWLLVACNYEHTQTLPAAPSVPAVIHTITGTVRDGGGRPIEGATITIRVTTKGSPIWRTDAAGRYEIRLAASSYTFIISKPGFRQILATMRLDNDTTADFALEPAAAP